MAILVCAVVEHRSALAQESHVGKLTGNAKRGKALYERYCIFCHGAQGDGQGESAPYLNPKPRDFTKAVFKCRSTPSGSLPLDSDLYDTISRGIHASGMPSWKPLLRQERADLVAYIKTFSSAFQEEKPGEPVQIPPEPANSADSIKRGCGTLPEHELLAVPRQRRARSWTVGRDTHRQQGQSDYAVRLHQRTAVQVRRDGSRICSATWSPVSMALRCLHFVSAMTADQRWDVVHYIRTLSAPKAQPEAKSQPSGQ